MRLLFAGLLIAVMAIGCAGLTPQEQEAQRVAALRAWLGGPMLETCADLPGPDSRLACRLVIRRSREQIHGGTFTREEHFRIELAKAKAADETSRLWTRTENEAWLRGPRATACPKGPAPVAVQACLESVENDLEGFREEAGAVVDPPEVRAERATARLEARDRAREIDRQRAHELELSRTQAQGQAMMGFFLGGGFRSFDPLPAYQPPPPIQYAPAYQAPPVRPPVNCTSNTVGQYTYTNCN